MQPKSVYRRRRLILLLSLLAVVGVVLLLVFRPGSSSTVPSADSTKKVELPSDLKTTGTSTATPSPSSSADDLPGCKKSNLAVTVAADSNAYGPGQNPALTMTISNTGKSDCVVDLGTKNLSFEIYSGEELYWKSVDCQVEPDSREVVLQPGKPLTTEPLVWDRTRSSPDTCGAARPAVPAGGAAYNVRAIANTVKSSPTFQFLLND